MTHKTFETFSNVLRTQANLWIASRDAGTLLTSLPDVPSRKTPVFGPKTSPRSAPSQKTMPRLRTTKNRRSRPDGPRERRKSLRLEVGRPGLCIPGCSDTPECKGTAGVDLARVPVAHGRCRDTLRSWQQPEKKSCQITPSHFKTSCSFRSKYG